MGQELTIQFLPGAVPGWDDIRGQLARVGELAPLRMIDGLPAFPDETPEPGWQELRLGTGAGMMTLRRSGDALSCVIWGNADPALLAARDRVAWACAAAGKGTVATPTGSVSADEFAVRVGLSPS
jgi:hypothetical protein